MSRRLALCTPGVTAGIFILLSSWSNAAMLKDVAALAGDNTPGVAHTEPSIGFNPANSNQIAIVAFSGNWGPSAAAPVWKSSDGGNTWRRVSQIVQPATGQFGPGDQKIAFDRQGRLYVAELAFDSLENIFDYIYRQGAAPDAPMTFGAPYGWDQPHLEIDTGGSNSCVDTLYSPWLNTRIGNNQSNVERSSNFGAAVSGVAAGDNLNFPNRTTRVAVARHGEAYIVYKTREGLFSSDHNFELSHFWVKRSDDCGATWNALGGAVSITGAAQVKTYFTNSFGAGPKVNRARSSDAWIATGSAGWVYVSYVDRDDTGFGQIYVARSSDSGAHWSTARVTDGTHNSAFPEIAVAGNGGVGVLYVDYDASGAATTYGHRLARSTDYGQNWSDEVLQSLNPAILANITVAQGYQFIWGDYEGLTATLGNFYGVFTGASIGRATPQLDPIFFKEAASSFILFNPQVICPEDCLFHFVEPGDPYPERFRFGVVVLEGRILGVRMDRGFVRQVIVSPGSSIGYVGKTAGLPKISFSRTLRETFKLGNFNAPKGRKLVGIALDDEGRFYGALYTRRNIPLRAAAEAKEGPK